MESIIIEQKISKNLKKELEDFFKNWDKKDLWNHYYHLQQTPNKINNKILKFVIKEIKSR